MENIKIGDRFIVKESKIIHRGTDREDHIIKDIVGTIESIHYYEDTGKTYYALKTSIETIFSIKEYFDTLEKIH